MRDEVERKITIEFLRLVNACANLRDLLASTTAFFQECSGCDAVGVRMRDGEDFPYCETRGFSREFVELERSLCVLKRTGKVQRDKSGRAVLACFCGSVLRAANGTLPPKRPFWTNNAPEAVCTMPEDDRRFFRGRCLARGYRSMALLPLGPEEEPIGLLQFNSLKENFFTLEDIGFWERLAAKFAIALIRFKAEEDLRQSHGRLELAVQTRTNELLEINAALRQSEKRFQQMAAAIRDVYWLANATFTKILYASPAFETIWGLPVVALKQNPLAWLDAVHPDHYDEVRGLLDYDMQTLEDSGNVEFRIIRSDGGIRWVSVYAFPVRNDAGRVYRLAGVVRDITERKRAEEAVLERESALRRANRALLVLKQCDEALLRATDEASLLKRVCATVVEVGGAKLAWVGFAENDPEKTVRPVASAGDDCGYLENIHVVWADTEHGADPTGLAIRNREVNVCHDIANAPRMAPWRREHFRRGFAAIVALPLVWEQSCLGVLTILSQDRNAFHADEIDLLKQLAGDLTFGIVSLRTRAEREQLQRDLLKIAEREKQLISQELHDGLCQNLTGTSLMATLLQRRLAARNDEFAEQARQISNLLNTSVNEARNLSHGLHPIGPEGEGLMSALATLAGTVTNLFHLRCTFYCPEPVVLENEIAATHLLRVAQEAINNARKHGQADEITIGLLNVCGGIMLTIEDDGIGIPRTLPKKRGLGLKTMSYRTLEIGASLSLRRAGERGTIVTCILPLASAARPES